ncbi:MAG: AMP-binding protein [Promethearchaeota archaeon]
MAIDKKIVDGIEKGNLTIGKLVDVVTDLYGDVEAAIFDDLRKTWKEFHKDIMKLSVNLDKIGLNKGDRIGVWSLNNYEWMVAWYGIPKIGGILIPMDSWYKPNEAKFILSHSGSRAVIATSNYLPVLESLKDDLPDLEFFFVMDKSEGEISSDKIKIISMKDILNGEVTADEEEKVQKIQDSVDKNDVTFILYTSGTTGVPKGAQLTHLNIIKNTIATADVLRCTPRDKYLIPVPFSHCFGCVLGITLATLTGSSMIPLKDQTPSVALQKIVKEGATVAHGTPTHFIRYIREAEAHPELDTSCLRTGIIAGAPCPPETLKGIINVLKMEDIVIGYGLTEASPIVTLTSPDDDFDHRINSVGKAIPEIEVKIVDDFNNEVPVGEEGELVVKGYNVMKGYYKEPEMTKKAIDENGFLHTGDLATVDKDGYYKIVGRKKDMIIYGGFNVYPKIIEDFLLENPNIIEVAVVGVPDEEYGEVVGVAAKVEPGFTEQDLVDYCYGKINSPSVPRYVRFDIDIPLSGRGKVQKYKLRKIFADMLKNGSLGPKLVPTAVKNKKK